MDQTLGVLYSQIKASTPDCTAPSMHINAVNDISAGYFFTTGVCIEPVQISKFKLNDQSTI